MSKASRFARVAAGLSLVLFGGEFASCYSEGPAGGGHPSLSKTMSNAGGGTPLDASVPPDDAQAAPPVDSGLPTGICAVAQADPIPAPRFDQSVSTPTCTGADRWALVPSPS